MYSKNVHKNNIEKKNSQLVKIKNANAKIFMRKNWSLQLVNNKNGQL